MNAERIRKTVVVHFVGSLGDGGVSRMLEDHFDIMRHRDYDLHYVHLGAYYPIQDEIKEKGGHIYRIPIMEQGVFHYYKSLRALFDRIKPDIVHSHLNYASGIIAYAAKKSGVKVRITHVRGRHISPKWIVLFMPIFKLLIRRFSTCLLSVEKRTGEYYFGNKCFQIVRNGVNIRPYLSANRATNRLRETLGIEDARMLIGHVARFTPEKNHAFVLNIMQAMSKRGIDYTVVFAGDGPLMEEIKKRVQVMGLAKIALFLGYRQDIPDLMTMFDVTVLPSFTEGLPNVVLQSEAAATPVVLSDTITKDVDLGLGLTEYLPLNNAKAWADVILKLTSQQRPNADLIQERFDQTGFGLEGAVRVIEEIYSEQLAKAGSNQ